MQHNVIELGLIETVKCRLLEEKEKHQTQVSIRRLTKFTNKFIINTSIHIYMTWCFLVIKFKVKLRYKTVKYWLLKKRV